MQDFENLPDGPEDKVWKNINPDHIWVMDKLILSRKLGYVCGPVGLDVPHSNWYCVRPCVNMMGLGHGAQKIYLEKNTVNLPIGYFWCEWFEGRHLSVDYINGHQVLAVEGHKSSNTLMKWDKWIKVEDHVPLPDLLQSFVKTYPVMNCEFIGGHLIEVHFRHNTDFDHNNSEFIPVWQGQDVTPPAGYRFVKDPESHGRVGAFVR